MYDRNGNQQIVFTKGDPYLMDMTHTHGHSALVTGIQWHPSEDNVRSLFAAFNVFVWGAVCTGWSLVFAYRVHGTSAGDSEPPPCVPFFTPQTIISCGNDGAVRVWDLVNAVRTFDKEIKNSQVCSAGLGGCCARGVCSAFVCGGGVPATRFSPVGISTSLGLRK